MSQPVNKPAQGDSNGILYLMVGGAVVVVGLPAVIIGLVLGRMSRGKQGWLISLGLFGVLGVGVLLLQRYGLRMAFEELREATRPLRSGQIEPLLGAMFGLWWRTLPAAPMVGLLYEQLRPKSEAEQEIDAAHLVEQRHARQTKHAAKQASKAPDYVTDKAGQKHMVLGAAGQGSGPALKSGTWATLSAELLNRHIVVLGENGTGKSELVLRLAYGAAVTYGWRIYILDLKGSPQFAAQVKAALTRVGIGMRRFPQTPYNAWHGTHEQIYNKLIGALEFSEPFYKQTVEAATRLAVYAGLPPRSSSDFLKRFDVAFLEHHYRDDPAGMQRLMSLERKHLQSAYMRYDAFFSQLQGMFDGRWSFENVQAAYFLLDGVALREQARTAARWLLADFAQFVAERLPLGERALLIVDEYPAVAGAADAARLFEQVRSPRGNGGAGVVVTSQSYAGLGERQDAERMISAAGTTITLRQMNAEPIAQRAGMRQMKRKSISTTPARGFGTPTPYSVTQREEEDYLLSPELIRRLGIGECVVIPTGMYQQVSVSRVPLSAEEVARAEMLQEVDPVVWRVDPPHSTAGQRPAPERLPQLDRPAPEQLPQLDRPAPEQLPQLDRPAPEQLPQLDRPAPEVQPTPQRASPPRRRRPMPQQKPPPDKPEPETEF